MIKVLGNNVQLNTGIKVADIKAAAKLNTKVLEVSTTVDGVTEVHFVLGHRVGAEGMVKSYCLETNAADRNGNAIATFQIDFKKDATDAEIKRAVAEKIGNAKIYLTEIASQIAEALEQHEAEMTSIIEDIELV